MSFGVFKAWAIPSLAAPLLIAASLASSAFVNFLYPAPIAVKGSTPDAKAKPTSPRGNLVLGVKSLNICSS